MIVLDEIIKAFECCKDGSIESQCEDCPYVGIGNCCHEKDEDALNFLKDFKRLSEMWNDKLDKEQDNHALTWDELEQMQCKPVWVESHGDTTEYVGWAIIRYITNDIASFILTQEKDGFLSLEITVLKSYMGKEWKAYKKERYDTR